MSCSRVERFHVCRHALVPNRKSSIFCHCFIDRFTRRHVKESEKNLVRRKKKQDFIIGENATKGGELSELTLHTTRGIVRFNMVVVCTVIVCRDRRFIVAIPSKLSFPLNLLSVVEERSIDSTNSV